MNEVTGIGDATLLEMVRLKAGNSFDPKLYVPKDSPDVQLKPDSIGYEFDPTNRITLQVSLTNSSDGIHAFIGKGVDTKIVFNEQELDWLITVLQLVKEDIRHD